MGMISIAHLLELADCYEHATGMGDKTLSFRVFGDSKKLTAMRGGADITIGRFNAAISWFSQSWPADVAWPTCIDRPQAEIADA
jgi:hypothetical protein